MIKKTLEKSYYYDLLEYMHDLGYEVEYILDAFIQAMTCDNLYDILEYITRTHEIDLDIEE